MTTPHSPRPAITVCTTFFPLKSEIWGEGKRCKDCGKTGSEHISPNDSQPAVTLSRAEVSQIAQEAAKFAPGPLSQSEPEGKEGDTQCFANTTDQSATCNAATQGAALGAAGGDTRICRVCDGGPRNQGTCLCGMKAWDEAVPWESRNAQIALFLRLFSQIESLCNSEDNRAFGEIAQICTDALHFGDKRGVESASSSPSAQHGDSGSITRPPLPIIKTPVLRLYQDDISELASRMKDDFPWLLSDFENSLQNHAKQIMQENQDMEDTES